MQDLKQSLGKQLQNNHHANYENFSYHDYVEIMKDDHAKIKAQLKLE
jgi:hypothetical protein